MSLHTDGSNPPMGFMTGCTGVGVGVGLSAWTGWALGRAADASGSAHSSAQPAAGCLLRDEAMVSCIAKFGKFLSFSRAKNLLSDGLAARPG